MAKSKLGKRIEAWQEEAKQDIKLDLEKLPRVPRQILNQIVDKIAKTSPACNTSELVALEAERHSISNPDDLSSVVAAVTFILANLEGRTRKARSVGYQLAPATVARNFEGVKRTPSVR